MRSLFGYRALDSDRECVCVCVATLLANGIVVMNIMLRCYYCVLCSSVDTMILKMIIDEVRTCLTVLGSRRKMMLRNYRYAAYN